MGSSSSKGTPQAAPATPLVPILATTMISSPARLVPTVISTVSFISTVTQSEPVRLSTVRETIIESIIISVTATPSQAAIVTPSQATIVTPSPAAIATPAVALSPLASEISTTPTPTLTPTPTPSSSASSGANSRSLSKSESGPSASPQRAAATAPSKTAATAAAAIQTPQPEVVQENVKKPIAPPDAILGGIPNKQVDLPVTIVFLIFFMTGAVTHFTIHEVNSKRGHKFHLSDLVFDFCMVRTVTCTMRIVWIFRPSNNSVVLAALIFEGAGVVVLFAVNAFFTQRLIRSIHPKVGWSGPGTAFFWAIIVSVPGIIFWNIINATLSVFLIKPKQASTIHDLVIFGSSYTLFLCVIPIIFLGIAGLFPSSTPPERFGKGGIHSKILILILASVVLAVGAIIRLIDNVKLKPIDNPGALNSKAVFYVTGFMLEIMVVAGYALARIDLRFHVPDGCTGPGDYSNPKVAEDDKDKLIEEEDVEVKMDIPIDSYVYKEYVPPAPYAIQPSSPPGTPSSGGAMPGTMPRRPPRSIRWEERPRNADMASII